MRRIFFSALLVLFSAAIFGCKPADPPGHLATGIVLKPGKGAVLVSFPKMDEVSRENWLAMINLNGPHKTHMLPRVPMTDLQSLLVLDIEPGIYSVSAQAWLRKNPPATGGILKEVNVEAGTVVLLRAQKLPDIPLPEPTVPLIMAGKRTWVLQSDDQLHEYLSKLVREAEKG